MFSCTASKLFLKLLVTITVAPIITGTLVHFRFHIRCISIHKFLYFNFFSASFCTTFLSAGIATSISVHVFSFLLLIIISIIIIIIIWVLFQVVPLMCWQFAIANSQVLWKCTYIQRGSVWKLATALRWTSWKDGNNQLRYGVWVTDGEHWRG